MSLFKPGLSQERQGNLEIHQVLVLQHRQQWMICLSRVEDEFHLWSDLENDANNEEARHNSSGKCDDNDDDNDGNDNSNGLLQGYESDNAKFGLMQSSDDEHPLLAMSHVLGGIKCLSTV